MSNAKIRIISGLLLGTFAVLAGGGYFLQLWRKATLKAAAAKADLAAAEKNEKDKGPPAKPSAAPLADDAEPPADLGAFDRSKFSKRKPPAAAKASLTDEPRQPRDDDSGSEFVNDKGSLRKPKKPAAGGGFDEQPSGPSVFGGASGGGATGGGGFDEAGGFNGPPAPRGAASAALSDDPPAEPTEAAELDPPAPSRFSPPPARLADSGTPKSATSRRPDASAPPDLMARPAAQLTDDPINELAAPEAAPPARALNSGRPRATLGGFAGDNKIDGPHADGQGAPGPKQLEGVQAPSLALEKAAPPEIQVGKPATFQIKVRNVGQADAHEVAIHDEVPKGTKFVDSTPPAGRAPDGSLVWQLGTIRPGEEQTISLQLMPTAEGEIGSVARVTFQAQASARTISTRPQLKVEHTAPSKVLIGQGVSFSIKISNPGTGAATNVVLEEDVPDGLSHPAGSELEFEVGTLRPGESKTLELTLKAEKPGPVTNILVVRGDAGLSTEDRVQVEVLAPQLEVEMKGPTRRFLDRQATYEFSVSNRGTAPAKEVELVAFLPKGFKFVETNNAGQYDAQKHAVYWSLAELPPAEAGAVKLITIPIEAGEQKLRLEGRADLGLADAREQAIMVESVSQLMFEVTDSADPIEVGSDTIYQVRIVNQGTKAATNVRVSAAIPSDMQPVNGDGPSRVNVEGQKVQFEPLARLAPKSEAVYRIQVKGLKPGDPRIRVQVISDESQTPVMKEESTKVYADQ